MGFFDKVKKGVSEAGSKAKVMVEVNRLKVQISHKENEIKEYYEQIGKIIFDAIQEERFASVESDVRNYCDNIITKQDEIAAIRLKIKEINDEKDCPKCGKTLEISVRFCPGCGHEFCDVIEKVDHETV